MLTHIPSIVTYLAWTCIRSCCGVFAARLIKLLAVLVVLKLRAAVQNETVFNFCFWSGKVVA